MTDLAEAPKREVKIRDEETITRGLVALVAASGNTRKASEALEADGIEIPQETLYYWRAHSRKEEYERLREQMLPEIRKRQADAHRALEQAQLEASIEGTTLIKQALPQMEHKDLINAVGKMDIGSGIHAEKAQLLDDQPTSIVKRDASEVLRKLKHRGQVLEAEVVAEEDVEDSGSSAGVVDAPGTGSNS